MPLLARRPQVEKPWYRASLLGVYSAASYPQVVKFQTSNYTVFVLSISKFLLTVYI